MIYGIVTSSQLEALDRWLHPSWRCCSRGNRQGQDPPHHAHPLTYTSMGKSVSGLKVGAGHRGSIWLDKEASNVVFYFRRVALLVFGSFFWRAGMVLRRLEC